MSAIGGTAAQTFIIGLKMREAGAREVDVEIAEQTMSHLDVGKREVRPGNKGIGGQPCIGDGQELVEDIEIGGDLFRILQ